ncbi:MAG: CoA pyrophosphatase [Magnetococcales bacterium]|nr:CoA pyrophosphatase [Magnetococcales bacterium]NGZ25805.1 CoA pyrophosphatase [Magnetococcales bacterium]
MPHETSPGKGALVVQAGKPPWNDLVAAAVLAPLYMHDGEVRLLLIRRSDTVAHHRGQYAFPGGRWEASDGTLWQTALRECREELGWDTEELRHVATLPTQVTHVSGFRIQPYLVWAPSPLQVIPQGGEVAGVIGPPLHFFWQNHGQAAIKAEKEGGPCYNFHNRTIWGATARIIHHLMPILARSDLIHPKGR